MEFWALINNRRIGPMEPEALAQQGLRPDTLVWRQGMADWAPAHMQPELQPYLAQAYAPEQPYAQQPPYNQHYGQQPYGQQPYGQPDYGMAQQQQQFMPPMPPNYMIWSVISLVLCCTVSGVIALIYSILVEYRYTHGNYEGARKASTAAMWWNIASIVAMIIIWPLLIMLGVFGNMFNGY